LIDSDNLKNLLHPEVLPQLGKIRKKHEDLGSVGAVGCSLSHYKVWNQIIEQNAPALVVEDDLICHPMFRNFKLTRNISMLNDYDFVLLSTAVRESALFDTSKLKSNQGIVPYHGLFFGTHFYYLTPEGARFFLNNFFPLQYQVDSFMSFRIKKNRKFRIGVHYPEMGYQSGGSTDIQTPMDSVFSKIIVQIKSAPIHKKIAITFCGLCVLFVVLFLIAVSVQFLL
jgi:GR25 family glycosyltransferase involved in LPS biosynthesis